MHVWIKDISYSKQKPHPCQVGGDNGRLNFTSGGLNETTAWVYTDVSQRLFVVCSIPSHGWVTLLVAPNTISSSGIHTSFGAIRPIVSFRFLVYICHHACWEESSKIHQIHLCASHMRAQALFPVNWRDSESKVSPQNRKGTNVCTG